jgi:hypothetical protein
MTPAITLTRAMSDAQLFGKVFGAPSFWTWRVVAKLIDGIPLTESREIELFEQCIGRRYVRQAWRRLILLAGRRAGKDRFESAVAVWRAALCADWRKYQSVGEGAVVILLGADKKQASILRNYCSGLLQAPLLAAEVTRSTGEVTEFRNGASLEISTNDARLVRGRSAIAVLGSECCHWKTDEYAASSDEEVVAAAEPSMAMCPDGGLLMLGSSVYRKRGYMFRKYRELFGNDAGDDQLCWFAPSQVMNPVLPQSVIDRALATNLQGAGRRGKAEEALQQLREIMRKLKLSAFTRVTACTLALSPIRDPHSEGFSYFVTSIAGSGDSMYTRKAYATREAPRRPACPSRASG